MAYPGIPGVGGLPDRGPGPMPIRGLGDSVGSQNTGAGAAVSRQLGAPPPTIPPGRGGLTVKPLNVPPGIPGIGSPPGRPGPGLQSPIQLAGGASNPAEDMKKNLYKSRADIEELFKLGSEINKKGERMGLKDPAMMAKYMSGQDVMPLLKGIMDAQIKADQDKEMKQQGLDNKSTPQLAQSGIQGPPVPPGARASVPPQGRMFAGAALPRSMTA